MIIPNAISIRFTTEGFVLDEAFAPVDVAEAVGCENVFKFGSINEDPDGSDEDDTPPVLLSVVKWRGTTPAGGWTICPG